MDILSGNYLSKLRQAQPFWAVLQPARRIAQQLTGFFTFTRNDQSAAGIYLDGEGRGKTTNADQGSQSNDTSNI